jgi:dihydrofolate synthase/folylpolyglutamate synthase
VGSSKLPNNLDDWLTLLEHRHPVAIDLGLERCRAVWELMGSPQPAPEIFVVAGTNGKGSTVATICSLLGGLGLRYGSYTTPHLLRFNERVMLNGQAVSDGQLLQAFEIVEAARGDLSLSYFEFGTLAAFSILARSGVDCAVMEVGLGGRLDAVNLLDADCAVITPIGLDHQQYLGDDLNSIGREKAGIIRPGQPVICGEPEPPASIAEAAASNGADLKRLGVDFTMEQSNDSALFRVGQHELPVPLPVLAGPHQLNNMATALAAVLELHPDAVNDPRGLNHGLRTVKLRGRLERVGRHPPVWVDVGHNPMAARAVVSALAGLLAEEGLRACKVVLAMLNDKDAAAVVQEFAPVASGWYLAGLQGDRGQTGQELATQLEHVLRPGEYQVYKGVGHALEAALADCDAGEGVLVFGSFLTAADALQHRLLLESTSVQGNG